MDKSRQRQYPVVKSRLNWIRELFILLCSAILWSYCFMVIAVLAATLLNTDTYLIQLIRTMLNIERDQIIILYRLFTLIAVVITLYLTFICIRRQRSVSSQSRRRSLLSDQYHGAAKKFFNMLLLLLVLSLIVNDSAAAVKKLPADKNACLGLNYHRVREQNFIDSMLMLLSNSKELNIYSITDQSFDNQLKWLTAHNARFVTLDELLSYKESGHFPARCVWINFDDMDSTIEKNAQPILKKYNVPATGFVITGEVGNPNFHNLKMIDYSGLKAMEDSGLWTFASHTDKLHSIVKKTSMFIRPENQAAIQQDINNSTDYLAENLNGNVTAMAYPYGQIDDEVIEELKKTQLTYGFTLEDDVITPDSDDYYLPRILINDDSFNTLVKTWEGFQ